MTDKKEGKNMRLKDCESCLVYGSDRKPLSRARVVEIKENVLQLFFTTSRLRNARLKTIVDFYDGQKGLVRSLCSLTLKKNPGFFETGEPWMADCAIVKVYEEFQRQKDVRAKVQLSTEFVLEDGSYVAGTIRNISAGGLFFVTSRELRPGDRFVFVHKFKTDVCRVSASVLRVQELQGGYGYGCQFMGLSPGEEADIRNFVYLKQIQRQMDRQKKLGLSEEDEV